MYEKGRKKGTLRFSLTAPDHIRQASVTGDFNGWKPVRMRRNKDGQFVAIVSAKPGPHEYKFLVDGDWSVDPENSDYSVNPYGTLNSVAHLV